MTDSHDDTESLANGTDWQKALLDELPTWMIPADQRFVIEHDDIHPMQTAFLVAFQAGVETEELHRVHAYSYFNDRPCSTCGETHAIVQISYFASTHEQAKVLLDAVKAIAPTLARMEPGYEPQA